MGKFVTMQGSAKIQSESGSSYITSSDIVDGMNIFAKPANHNLNKEFFLNALFSHMKTLYMTQVYTTGKQLMGKKVNDNCSLSLV